MNQSNASPLLEIEDLSVRFFTRDGVVRAVERLSLHVDPGETLSIVGESGCGKSVTAMSILRLLPMPPAKIESGSIRFDGEELLEVSEERMREIRGDRISMVFQEPMTSLNPVMTVGRQIAESLELHRGLSQRAAKAEAVAMLDLVQIPEPRRRADEYPHQMSGGMRQRVMIAMALACDPSILIADEPTTALDVTIQAQILDLMIQLKEKIGAAIVFITHDLGVVAETAQRVVVMYAGRKVEEASADDLFDQPFHPYTLGLMGSIPKLSTIEGAGTRLNEIPGVVPSLREENRRLCVRAPLSVRDRAVRARGAAARGEAPRATRGLLGVGDGRGEGAVMSAVEGNEAVAGVSGGGAGEARAAHGPAADARTVLEVRDLKKHFPVHGGLLRRRVGSVFAVDGISFEIRAGETLGLVGESGSGKSTAGKSILRLIDPTAGQVVLDGEDVTAAPVHRLRALRRQMQMVFQDPYASLNPRLSAETIVAEPLRNYGGVPKNEIRERVVGLFERVGLTSESMVKYPHEFSGGQRQRLGVARALALEPALIVADEPVSALDVSGPGRRS